MAELLTAGGWVEPGSLAAYLRETLPEGYVIVADPTVSRRHFDVVLVGPAGLVAMEVLDWKAVSRRRGGDLRAGASRANNALQAFLKDEFPGLEPAIYHRYVTLCAPPLGTSPGRPAAGWKMLEENGMSSQKLDESLTSSAFPPDPTMADEDLRENLGVALRDRRLTVSQRAEKPFTFRSGRLLGAASRVWTVRDAVRYMDRHPADGIYHLRNGSLAGWLAEQGAPQLADLARSVVLDAHTNYRAALEEFLLGTGLVERPKLVLRPRVVNLGYIIEGETGRRALRVRRGRGRGFLYGEIATSHPWLHIEPASFSGGPADFTVSAHTGSLLISREPYEAQLLVDCNAAAEPVPVPVRFRVVGVPSTLNRYFLRPLFGLFLGLLIAGALAGLWVGGVPLFPATFASTAEMAAPAGMLLLGAILGTVRGCFQPPAWPSLYAAARWLLKGLIWALLLGLLAVLSAGYWGQAAGANLSPGGLRQIGLIGAALAILPATLDEALIARRMRRGDYVAGRRVTVRPLALAGFALLLILLLVLVPLYALPAWEQLGGEGLLVRLQELADQGWRDLTAGVDGLLSKLYMWYYDR